jgi:hypothetical protein
MTGGGERESTKKPFYERGSFKAVVAVVGLAGGVWAFLGAPTPWKAVGDLTDNPLPLRNTEIILDASSRMGEPFGQGTKLEVAVAAVAQYAAAGEHVGLALRRAGGGCEEAGDPIVGFDDDQSEAIRSAARAQEPGGESNVTEQVRAAIGDFSGSDFHRAGSENQIVVFVGGEDTCPFEGTQAIRNELTHAKIDASFQLFALDVSEQTLAGLEAMARELKAVGTAELHAADNVEELYEAVQEEVPGLQAADFESFAGPDETIPGTEEPETGVTEEEQAEEEQTEEGLEEEIEPEAGEVAPVEEGGGEAEGAAP